jgi:hypothetical protein
MDSLPMLARELFGEQLRGPGIAQVAGEFQGSCRLKIKIMPPYFS